MESTKELLGRRLRVRTSDNRVIDGDFQCVDREMNIMLDRGQEFHNIPAGLFLFCSVDNNRSFYSISYFCFFFVDIMDFDDMEFPSRPIGMVMIPGKHIVSCFVCSTSN